MSLAYGGSKTSPQRKRKPNVHEQVERAVQPQTRSLGSALAASKRKPTPVSHGGTPDYGTFKESIGPLFVPSFENRLAMLLAEWRERRLRHEIPFGLTQPVWDGHRQSV